MAVDPWLPIGYVLPDGETSRQAIYEDSEWQLYDVDSGGRVLVVIASLAGRWVQQGLLPESVLKAFSFGRKELRCFLSTRRYALVPVESARTPCSKGEALAFAAALRESRLLASEASFHDAIYAEQFSRLLPCWSLTSPVDDDIVLGTWVAGVRVSTRSFRRFVSLVGWMDPVQLRAVIGTAGLQASGQDAAVEADEGRVADNEARDPSRVGASTGGRPGFVLSGREALEQFFREHVIEIVENQPQYEKLGIAFPAAIVLHGPPGCGKTFAVERLVEYLGWPSFSIDSESVGSPFIHDTAKKTAGVFSEAIKAAPSVIVIDEMEALLSDRRGALAGGIHHVEEVAEFLRRIPEAINNRVLVVGMTNQVDLIDPAILRRGRFDHVVAVGMPTLEELVSLLEHLLSKIPKADVDIGATAQALLGRPLSDVAFVVREGARLAARASRSAISQTHLEAAVHELPVQSRADRGRPIGFR